MQETLTFPTLSSPRRFAFPDTFYDYSEKSSAVSTPFVSAPSSPGRIGPPGFYFSCPTSPNWSQRIEIPEDVSYTRRDFASAIPFAWEEKPGTPKAESDVLAREEQASFFFPGSSDFEFSARFSELEDPPMSPTPMSSANELFHNGQIRPLRPPPRLEQPLSVMQLISEEAHSRSFEFRNYATCSSSLSAPHSPRSPRKFGLPKGAFCGISSPVDQPFDPFAVALQEMTKCDNGSRHRRTRSLSPLRIFHWDEQSSKSSSQAEVLSRDSSVDSKEQDTKRLPKAYKKWRLKDLLHRSGGEGKLNSRVGSRGSSSSIEASSRTDKQSLRGSGRSEGSQSSVDLSPKPDSGKTKSTAGLQGNGTSMRTRAQRKSTRGSVSPHELHYTTQRAQTEELRKKTFLPYRQGLLGCLGFTSRSYKAVSNISKTLQSVSG